MFSSLTVLQAICSTINNQTNRSIKRPEKRKKKKREEMDDEGDRLNTIHSILVCLSKVKPDFKGVCGLVDIFYWPVFFFFSHLWQFYLQICIIFSRFSFFFCICEASLTQTWFWNPFFFPPSLWPLWELRPWEACVCIFLLNKYTLYTCVR